MMRKSDEAIKESEAALGRWLRNHLWNPIVPFILFVAKFSYASLFGAMLLLGLIVTRWVWSTDWAIARYDALLIYALALQAVMLLLRMETWAEIRVIFLFHLTGTAMEMFKVNMGSWSYPEAGFFKLCDVPLFSGFMYASVGSFITRAIRVCDMRFAPFAPKWMLFALAGLIYINFFTHHFIPDLRYALIVASLVLFWRTRIWFRIDKTYYWLPMPLSAGLSSFFLWIAENIGTFTHTWIYNGAGHNMIVDLQKMGSWYMLLYLSFATVLMCSDMK